ncbi:MAG: universal stress protein [Dehalococcoidia bacterium]
MASQFTVLIGVTNSHASLEAVTAAGPIVRARRAKVILGHVLEVARHLPLQERQEVEARRGDQVLRRAEEAAKEAGYHAAGELLQAREAGQGILDEARDKEVDLIVLGVPAHREFGGFSLGRTAEYVLRHASCEVWVVRGSTTPSHAHHESYEVERR